jgi:hypothetical protein
MIHGARKEVDHGRRGRITVLARTLQDMASKQRIAVKYQSLAGLMDERMCRQWAAAEAAAYGWGGVRTVR